MSNVPTGPGWWYMGVTHFEIVYVYDNGYDGRLGFIDRFGDRHEPIDEDDVWRGPVPMPGADITLCDVCGAVCSSDEVWERSGPGNNDFDSVIVWKCRNGHETRSESTP